MVAVIFGHLRIDNIDGDAPERIWENLNQGTAQSVVVAGFHPYPNIPTIME